MSARLGGRLEAGESKLGVGRMSGSWTGSLFGDNRAPPTKLEVGDRAGTRARGHRDHPVGDRRGLQPGRHLEFVQDMCHMHSRGLLADD